MALPNKTVSPKPRHRFRWRRHTVIALSALFAVLLAARIAAPHFIKSAIDRRLCRIPGYWGHVEGVTLHVWRGAYRIDGMTIVKRSARVTEPFFSAERVDFSVAWEDIFRGRFVAQIYIRNGRLNFLRGPDEDSSQLNADRRWQDVVADLFPIDITYLDIEGGVLRFVDTTHSPKVDIAIHDLRVHATGLQNRPVEGSDAYPAKISISGVTAGDGQLHLFTKLEPMSDRPHFLLAMELKKVSLPAMNDFMRAYTGVEVAGGQFEVFAQMAMGNGRYEGYVKPFFSDVNFADSKDEKKSLEHTLWKAFVVTVSNLAKNSGSKQVATRIPFSGEASHLDIHIWKSIQNGLRHGFVQALSRGFEGSANPDSIASPVPGPMDAPARPKT
jgi:Domain of Unknown Function (DUF748)